MVFDREYIYDGVLRWNLGWPTPNFAGAFLATLLPWFWWNGRSVSHVEPKQGQLVLVAGLFGGIESVLWYCLAKTYSRGALLAVFAALVVWFVITPMRKPWLGMALRVLVAGLCIVGTGFLGRIGLGYVSGDAAVANRLSLWKGGLEMLAAAPLHGWGAGRSGWDYMNWYQPVDRTEGYTTMVNSYLHVGVEYGIVWLGVGLSIFAWLTLMAWNAARASVSECDRASLAFALADLWRNKRGLLQGGAAVAGASSAAWAVANVFSTLWIEPKLWIVPGFGAAIIILPVMRPSCALRITRPTLLAFGTAAIAIVALWMSGLCLSRHSRWRIEPASTSVVSITKKDSQIAPQAAVWHVWPDAAVLGRSPGKEIRRWLASSAAPTRVLVHDSNTSEEDIAIGEGGRVMLVGREAGRLSDRMQRMGTVVLVHPSGPLPSVRFRTDASRSITVLLPEIDERGTNKGWREWANAAGAEVIYSPVVGEDIRAAWPNVLTRETNGQGQGTAEKILEARNQRRETDDGMPIGLRPIVQSSEPANRR